MFPMEIFMDENTKGLVGLINELKVKTLFNEEEEKILKL